MENKLEQLLNSLIERGRCPFGKKDVYIETGEGYDFGEGFIILKKKKGGTYTCESKYMQYRMLCTKSSGLWQFVCENGMVKIEYGKIREKYDETNPTTDKNKIITYRQLLGEDNYEYRLIESALKDESELEEFLLNSIKIEGIS